MCRIFLKLVKAIVTLMERSKVVVTTVTDSTLIARGNSAVLSCVNIGGRMLIVALLPAERSGIVADQQANLAQPDRFVAVW